jgi:hypothetical protein
VFCQLEVLRHCFPSSVRQILEELPESLDETYERILKEIESLTEDMHIGCYNVWWWLFAHFESRNSQKS